MKKTILLVVLGVAGWCAADGFKVWPESETDPVLSAWKLAPGARWIKEDGEMVLETRQDARDLGPGFVTSCKLDPAAYRGKALHLSGEIELRGVTKPDPFQTFFGAKLVFYYNAGGVDYHLEPKTLDHARSGTYSWRGMERDLRFVPQDAKGLMLTFGLQGSTGVARYRRVKFDVIKSYEPKLPIGFRCQYTEKCAALGRLRGVMSPAVWELTEKDIRDLQKWGANVMRWQFVWPDHLAKGKDPVKGYQAYLEDRLAHLESLLPVFRACGINVIIDIHAPPGGRGGNVILGTAGTIASGNEASNTAFKMFFDERYYHQFLHNWELIARRFKDNDTVVAYDLENEPDQQIAVTFDYLKVQEEAARRIRRIDPEKPVIVTVNEWANPQGFGYLKPIPFKNVIYTFHMYEPGDYTHQGVFNNFTEQRAGRFLGYPKPGQDRAWLRARMQPARDFQRKWNARIYVGEFGVVRCAPGAARYLDDLCSLFEEYGWDWTFHAYREWINWSVEHSANLDDTAPCAEPTDRLKVLLKYFGRNEL